MLSTWCLLPNLSHITDWSYCQFIDNICDKNRYHFFVPVIFFKCHRSNSNNGIITLKQHFYFFHLLAEKTAPIMLCSQSHPSDRAGIKRPWQTLRVSFSHELLPLDQMLWFCFAGKRNSQKGDQAGFGQANYRYWWEVSAKYFLNNSINVY